MCIVKMFIWFQIYFTFGKIVPVCNLNKVGIWNRYFLLYHTNTTRSFFFLILKLLLSFERECLRKWLFFLCSMVEYFVLRAHSPRQNKYLVVCPLSVPSIAVSTLICVKLDHLDKSCFSWCGWSHPLQWLQPPAVHRWIPNPSLPPEVWILMHNYWQGTVDGFQHLTFQMHKSKLIIVLAYLFLLL